FDASTVSCRGRGGRVRAIPLAEAASAALRQYLANGRPFLARSDGAPVDALFLNHRGSRLTRQGFWLIMRERAKDAGIAVPMTPHSLRHSFAYQRLDDGTPLRDLKELMGHMNISTTQIYKLAVPNAAKA